MDTHFNLLMAGPAPPAYNSVFYNAFFSHLCVVKVSSCSGEMFTSDCVTHCIQISHYTHQFLLCPSAKSWPASGSVPRGKAETPAPPGSPLVQLVCRKNPHTLSSQGRCRAG